MLLTLGSQVMKQLQYVEPCHNT